MLLTNHAFDLQLLAEEEAADAGALASSTAEAGTDTGEQVAAAQEQPVESFESLIKGRYKEDYHNAVQQAINRRFRNQQDNQQIIDSMNPVMTMLAARYGIQPDENGALDYQALHDQIANDNSMYEEEAFQRGMNVEDLKHMRQLEFQNAQLQRQMDASLRDEQSRREFQALVEAGEQLKQIYPDFNLGIEMENPDFGRLVAVNVPLRTAYEIVHHDEIMEGSMRYAVQQTQQKISNSIQSGMKRPAENGTSSQSAGDVGAVDPSKFSLKDFAKIKARAERGERITY